VRRLALVLALAAVGCASPSAAAGQGVFAFSSEPGTKLTEVVTAELKVTGSVSVEFHGDAAAGCSEAGLCGMSGTVTWDPHGGAQLFVIGYREHGVRYEDGFLAFGGGPDFENGPSTSAQVRRAVSGSAPAGLCSDADSSTFALVGLTPQLGSSLDVRLTGASGVFGTDSFRTRCAGPATSDLSALLPSRAVTSAALRRGHRNLDFRADRDFASHGLAGTVHSTVVLHVSRAQRITQDDQSGQEPRGETRKRRRLDVHYRIERVSGQVGTDVAGLADPDLCGPLDACGLLGTVTLAPKATSGEAVLEADGPARRSSRDLRRALGLLPGAAPTGIRKSGYAAWDDDFGTATAALTRAGAPDCRDSEPLSGGGSLSLRVTRTEVRAEYGTSADATGTDLLRTRCPGPGIDDVARSRPLASGTVPLRSFRARRVTLLLTRGTGFSSDGYSGHSSADVTVVLRRVGVDEQVYEDVSPAFRRLPPALALRLP
jgi:hypothetical protein